MRYGIYFTPPSDAPLTIAGANWLGRDAFQDSSQSLPKNRAQFVAIPAKYGFHATLKAPFELASDKTESELRKHFTAFCKEQDAFIASTIKVQFTGKTFVLALDRQSTALTNIANTIVETFEQFRAPLSEFDIARRRPNTLSQSQRTNLMKWGYPHVMDDFQFHMTLSGTIPEDQQGIARHQIETHFADFIGKPLEISGLGLFIEPARGQNFYVAEWQAFKD